MTHATMAATIAATVAETIAIKWDYDTKLFLLDVWENGCFDSHHAFRTAIPIPITVPQLHHVHSQSHGIFMGKWES